MPSSRRPGLAALLAVGATLARRGAASVIALSTSALTIVVLAIVAIVLARRGPDAPIHDLPLLAARATAWGGALLHGVVASANARRRDRVDGIQHLFVMRDPSLRGYVVARIGGLAVWLAAAVAGGAIVIGLLAIAAGANGRAITLTAQSTAASVVFGLAFAVVISPLVFATFGSRSRGWGFVAFFAILLVPEIVADRIGASPEIAELCALPSALAVLRDSLMPGSFDLLRAARAVLVLALASGVAITVARRSLARLPEEEPG